MLCNNTQRYEWHPVHHMRVWVFAWRVGPKGFKEVGGVFTTGAKFTKRQMRLIKKTMRRDAQQRKAMRRAEHQRKLTAERIPDHRPVTDPKFIHEGFPYQHRETSPRCRKHNVRVKPEQVDEMIAAGYRRTSRAHQMIARIDRPDWREYMAFQHSPWDPAGQGMDWVNALSDSGAGDFYRRCYSEDIIQLADNAISMMFPASGWDNVGYKPMKGEETV